MIYQGKELSEFFTSQLVAILDHLKEMDDKRIEASKHEKFKKMEFPPHNPAYLELKSAIEEEIRKRENA